MKTRDGGAPGVVTNSAETFGRQNLQTAILDVLFQTGAAYVSTERINSLYRTILLGMDNVELRAKRGKVGDAGGLVLGG
jgi:hypothetical protein